MSIQRGRPAQPYQRQQRWHYRRLIPRDTHMSTLVIITQTWNFQMPDKPPHTYSAKGHRFKTNLLVFFSWFLPVPINNWKTQASPVRVDIVRNESFMNGKSIDKYFVSWMNEWTSRLQSIQVWLWKLSFYLNSRFPGRRGRPGIGRKSAMILCRSRAGKRASDIPRDPANR